MGIQSNTSTWGRVRAACSVVYAPVLLMFAISTVATPVSARAVDLDRVVEFSIEQQSIESALIAFSKQAHIQVIISPRVDGAAEVHALNATVSARVALDTLLRNTGLTYAASGESVNVTRVRGGSRSDSGVAPGNAVLSGASPEQGTDRQGLEPSIAKQTANRGPKTEAGRGTDNRTRQSGALEEVVVTAQKREERLQDVPIPVTAISANTLIQNNQVLMRDYFSSIPGFSVSPSPGSGAPQQIVIRGVTAGPSVPVVGITIDDVPFGSSVATGGGIIPDIDPSDLQRIEVLRGPQGTLYGANSMGGLVRFVTVDPSTDRYSGQLGAGFNSVHNGGQLGYKVNGAMNAPLSENFALRISGFDRQDPGYIDNVYSHVNGVNEAHDYGGRLSSLWRPTETFSLKLGALFQNLKGNGGYDVDVPTAGFPSTVGLGDLQQNYLPGLGRYEKQIQTYSAVLNAKPGNVDFTSVTGYSSNKYFQALDFTYSLGSLFQKNYGAGGAGVLNEGEVRKFSQEVRASIPIGERIQWLIGGFYTHELNKLTQDLSALNPVTGATLVLAEHSPFSRPYTEYAGFTDLTFTVTDRFDIQLGGREGHYTFKYEQYTATGPLVGGSSVQAELGSSGNSFTYLATPRFKVTPDLMTYARFASGYRPGGPNNLGSPTSPLYDPTTPRQFNPDKTKDYEVGVKGNLFDHAVSYDASLYYVDFNGIQIATLDPKSLLSYTSNAGNAKSQGAELSVQAHPTTGLTLSAWVAWNDAVLTQKFPSTLILGAKGDRLPYSSRLSESFSVDEQFALTSNLVGVVGGAVTYAGDRLGQFTNTTARSVYPAYAKVDLRAGVRYESWSVDAYVNNAADRRGVLGGGLGTFPPYAFVYIQPRTIGLNASKAF